MTEAILFCSHDGTIQGFSVKGHSGYAEEGHDIVCAAASVLSITCINALEETAGVKLLVSGGSDGFLEAFLPDSLLPQQLHDSQIIMKTLRRGMQDLAQEYPRFFRFAIKERRKQK